MGCEVGCYEHLIEEKGMVWVAGHSASGRFRAFAPILMTTLVGGFGLLPLAIGVVTYDARSKDQEPSSSSAVS